MFDSVTGSIQILFFAVFLVVVALMLGKHFLHIYRNGWRENGISVYWRRHRKKR